jgi:hypothetical protein
MEATKIHETSNLDTGRSDSPESRQGPRNACRRGLYVCKLENFWSIR